MRQVNREVREIRWRMKATVAMAAIGGWLGGWAWILAGFNWSAPGLPQLLSALPVVVGDPYFWAVVALSILLGGWLAWMLMWRSRADAVAPQDVPQGGMSAPKF